MRRREFIIAARRRGGGVAVRGAGAAGQLDSNHHRADHCQRCFIANLDNREGRHRRRPFGPYVY